VNAIFSPSAERLDYTRRVVEAFKQAERNGMVSIQFMGKLLNYPIVEKDRRVLERVKAIDARSR